MFPYSKLLVYQKAFSVNQQLYRLLKTNKSIIPYAKNQLGRASFSIMLNIAEGSAKFSNRDRRNFYITARGSAFECASAVSFLYEEKELEKKVHDELLSQYEEISKMLFKMIENLSK